MAGNVIVMKITQRLPASYKNSYLRKDLLLTDVDNLNCCNILQLQQAGMQTYDSYKCGKPGKELFKPGFLHNNL
jgi:hypothetical protein